MRNWKIERNHPYDHPQIWKAWHNTHTKAPKFACASWTPCFARLAFATHGPEVERNGQDPTKQCGSSFQVGKLTGNVDSENMFFCWELSHIPSLFGTCASMIFPDRSVKPSAEKWLEDCGFFEKGLLLLVLGRVSLPCKWWFTNIRQQKSLLHKFHNLHGQYVEGWLNISKLTFNSPISATHKGRGGIYITYKEELVGRVSIPNPRCLKMTHMTIAHVMSL